MHPIEMFTSVMLLTHLRLSIYLVFSHLKNRSVEVGMPPGSLLKGHSFTWNLVGFPGGWFFVCLSLLFFPLQYPRGGMGLDVRYKLQHQERKGNTQKSESSKGSSPAAPSLTVPNRK